MKIAIMGFGVVGSGIGEIRQSTFPVQLNPFPQDSVKAFHITHIMQDQPLEGILNVGLRIETEH